MTELKTIVIYVRRVASPLMLRQVWDVMRRAGRYLPEQATRARRRAILCRCAKMPNWPAMRSLCAAAPLSA